VDAGSPCANHTACPLLIQDRFATPTSIRHHAQHPPPSGFVLVGYLEATFEAGEEREGEGTIVNRLGFCLLCGQADASAVEA
jgi:hypothetical protein